MQVGKYELLERLGAGGMAEVWRAQLRGAGGFVKQVALKLVLETWTDDAEMTHMLIDEAKLSAALDFPSIVATLDFGFADGRYFIAMELVDGLPLSRCVRMLRRESRKLDLDLALHAAAEMLAALAYAHAARDAQGQPLGIVHRDVNPSNIMVSTHGEVKLADFGIAKAAGRRTQTEVGTLKGKFAYMSPEQAWGKSLDARSDVYAAGLTLLELLTLERAIEGNSDIETLESARAGTVRPLPDAVPDGVRAVLRRALAPDPGGRYPSAALMREELLACLSQLPRRDVRAELGRLVEATKAGLAALKGPDGPSPLPLPALSPTRSGRVTKAQTAAGAGEPPSRPRRTTQFLAFIVGCAAVGGGGVWLLEGREAKPPVQPAPAPARAEALPAAPTIETVAPAAAPAPAQAPARHRTPAVRTAPAAGAAAPVSDSDEPATLRIQVVPWGNVWVDEREAGQTPLTPLTLGAGRHQVRVVHPELGTRQQPVELRPGEAKLLTFDLSKGTK